MTIPSKALLSAALTVSVLAASRPALAQSLGDVAKQEEARRGGVKAPATVLTNKDLKPAPVIQESSESSKPGEGESVPKGNAASGANTSAAATPPGAAPSPDAKTGAASAPADSKAGDAKTEVVKDQAYYSGQLKALQSQLSRDQTLLDAMQTRINSLTADFANRDDPVQRNVISNDRKKAVDELSRLKDSIEKDKKAVADFTEEARKAGVPPGWLR